MNDNRAAPCGFYCGACRAYLLREKGLLEERGYKYGCVGCRIRNKKCAFIKRDCQALRKNEIEFCFQCDKFPCPNLKKLDKHYKEKYQVGLINNLKRNREIGVEKWLKEQEELYKCPRCGDKICIHDAECYECGEKINLIIKSNN